MHSPKLTKLVLVEEQPLHKSAKQISWQTTQVKTLRKKLKENTGIQTPYLWSLCSSIPYQLYRFDQQAILSPLLTPLPQEVQLLAGPSQTLPLATFLHFGEATSDQCFGSHMCVQRQAAMTIFWTISQVPSCDFTKPQQKPLVPVRHPGPCPWLTETWYPSPNFQITSLS